MRCIDQADLTGVQKALVRADLDVTIKEGAIQDDFRLKACLETLNYLQQKSIHTIICGHIGQPEGEYDSSLSTQALHGYFKDNLNFDNFEILENLRFDIREEENDLGFAQELADKADIYVNESFATCHREHTSIVGVPKILADAKKGAVYAGINLNKEIQVMNTVLENPTRPLVVLIGGIKIESKMPVINKFLSLADYVLLGGKLGLNWQGKIPEKLVLPTDYAQDEKDIGEQTIQKFVELVNSAETIIWAGPMGLYEEQGFSKGTKAIADAIAQSTKRGAFSLAGGGNTIEALNMLGFQSKMSFVSTGGGAMLEYLAKGTLPGIEALE